MRSRRLGYLRMGRTVVIPPDLVSVGKVFHHGVGVVKTTGCFGPSIISSDMIFQWQNIIFIQLFKSSKGSGGQVFHQSCRRTWMG